LLDGNQRQWNAGMFWRDAISPQQCPGLSVEKNRTRKHRAMETKEINGIDAEQAAYFQQSFTTEELARSGYFMTQEFSTRKHYRLDY
jgi:hypothetical protein